MQMKAQLLTENARKLGFRSIRKRLKACAWTSKNAHKLIRLMRRNLRWWLTLGSNISVVNSVQKDILARINKARHSYCSLRNIWKSNIYSLMTKVRLFNSNVISVLRYGCQSWIANKNDIHKMDVFQPNVFGGLIYLMKICTEGQILYQ